MGFYAEQCSEHKAGFAVQYLDHILEFPWEVICQLMILSSI